MNIIKKVQRWMTKDNIDMTGMKFYEDKFLDYECHVIQGENHFLIDWKGNGCYEVIAL